MSHKCAALREKSDPGKKSAFSSSFLSFLALSVVPAAAWAAGTEPPALGGIPIDFILFALTLIGVALFHRHTLAIAVSGLVVISLFKIAASPFPEGPGVMGWISHLGHEWVLLDQSPGPAARLCAPVEALRSEPFPRSCRISCPTTGRAAWCCWS